MKAKHISCPYCGFVALLKDASFIYRRPGLGSVYVCSNWPGCDAYVGVHEGTSKPKGTLANRELRDLRMSVHSFLDPLWLGINAMAERSEVYMATGQVLGIAEFYVGDLRETQAKAIVDTGDWLILDIRLRIERNRLAMLGSDKVSPLLRVLRYLFVDSQTPARSVLSFSRYRGHLDTFRAASEFGLVKRIKKIETNKVFYVLTPAGKSAIAANV